MSAAGPGAGHAWAALPEPRTSAGRAGLAAIVADLGRALVGLDFDGTLAPIVPDPEQARALPAAITALRRLAPQTGMIAVITGRPALAAVEYGRLDQVPGVVVLGHYGRQRWHDGVLESPPPPPGLTTARERLLALMPGAPAGTWLEEKHDAVAVHTRRAADPAGTLELLRPQLVELAAATGLVAEPGRFVIELRPPGADKGSAIKKLMTEQSFAAVMFCGDDLGDRPAFAAIRDLRGAGTPGLAVCSGSAEVPELAAEADLVVAGPAGVADLLAALADFGLRGQNASG